MKGLLIIVNYNQEKEVGAFLSLLLPNWPREQMVFVDDASTDRSAVIAKDNGLTVLQHPRNLGVGGAIRTGIRHALERGFDFIVIMSSNGKMRPEELPNITGPLLRGEADYVTGSRFLAGGSSPGLSLFRKTMIPLFSSVAALCLGRRFSDITCGYRAYRVDFLRAPDLNLNQDWLNTYELEYYIHYYACALGLRIAEVPVTILYDHLEPGRKSKIRPVSGWWKMVRPLLFLKLGLKR